MNLLQQNMTSKKIVLLLTTPDHVTGATGKTLTITRSKNGGSFASWAGSSSELANGWYALTPASGDVDTLGELAIHISAAGADPADVKYCVVAYDPYDAVRLGLTALPNAVAGASGGLPTADGSNAVKVQSGTGANQIALASGLVTVGTNNDKTGYGLADDAITAAKIATDAIDADAIKADAAAETAAAVVDQALSGHTNAGTVGGKLGMLGVGMVTFVAPVNPVSGDLEIVRGDDYTASSGRALPEWSSEDWTPFDLTNAESVTLRARARYSGEVFTKEAEVVSDTQVRVELTSAETADFAVGREAYSFDLQAILASGDVVTLVQGKIHVNSDVH